MTMPKPTKMDRMAATILILLCDASKGLPETEIVELSPLLVLDDKPDVPKDTKETRKALRYLEHIGVATLARDSWYLHPPDHHLCSLTGTEIAEKLNERFWKRNGQ